MTKLVLAHHTIDEWVVVRAEQARSLGCSASYGARLSARLRAQYGAPTVEADPRYCPECGAAVGFRHVSGCSHKEES